LRGALGGVVAAHLSAMAGRNAGQRLRTNLALAKTGRDMHAHASVRMAPSPARTCAGRVSRPKCGPENILGPPLDGYDTQVYYGTSRQLFFGKLGKFDPHVSGGQAAGLRGEA
jgi:hypothetical protein